MKKSTVAVVRCPDYEPGNLSRSIRRSLDLLGGLGAFLKPGSKVFVKVNHLSPASPPEKAVYTHPLFVQEVLRLLKDYDVDTTVGDEVFSQMLIDLFSCVPPHLTIMDAVVGMEGEGPSAGTPKTVGLILGSTDAVALDAAASRIVGYNPQEVFTTYYAQERGLGVGDMNLINIAGGKIDNVEVKDFRHSAAAVGLFRRKLPSFLYAYVQGQLALIPEVREEVCTGCSECASMCPARAIMLSPEPLS